MYLSSLAAYSVDFHHERRAGTAVAMKVLWNFALNILHLRQFVRYPTLNGHLCQKNLQTHCCRIGRRLLYMSSLTIHAALKTFCKVCGSYDGGFAYLIDWEYLHGQ